MYYTARHNPVDGTFGNEMSGVSARVFSVFGSTPFHLLAYNLRLVLYEYVSTSCK